MIIITDGKINNDKLYMIYTRSLGCKEIYILRIIEYKIAVIRCIQSSFDMHGNMYANENSNPSTLLDFNDIHLFKNLFVDPVAIFELTDDEINLIIVEEL